MVMEILMIIFGLVILFLLFLVFLMYRRIQQLLIEVENLKGRMNVTTTELETLSRNVEEYKKLKFLDIK